MNRYQTPNDLLWAIVDPETDRLFTEALARTPEETNERLRAKGYDLEALDRMFVKMLEDLPRHIGMKAVADALVPPRAKPPCLVSSGVPEADAVLALVEADDWTTWPGDEETVGIVVTVDDVAVLEWFPRDEVLRRFSGLDDPRAVVEMKRPAPGKVALLLGGNAVVLRVEVDAQAIRAAELLTSPRAGAGVGTMN